METLVILAQQRHVRQNEFQSQYCTRNNSSSSRRFNSSLTGSFREINCRTFHAGSGILTSPITIPPHSGRPYIEKDRNSKNNCRKTSRSSNKSRRSKSLPIDIASSPTCNKIKPFSDDFSCIFKETELFSSSPNSELWAGPAYSNSPPPSSLPIPKFSLCQKRSVSLDSPVLESEMKIITAVKSAPNSPTRELCFSAAGSDGMFFSPASATKNLRRILHLDSMED